MCKTANPRNLTKLAVCICTMMVLIHCSMIRPYNINSQTDTLFPPTDTVTIVHERPEQDYLVLADFVGREPTSCPEGLDLCTLRQKAQAMGAHAIWIRKHNRRHIPGDWIYENGRLIRIYPTVYDTYQGVFIRYTAP